MIASDSSRTPAETAQPGTEVFEGKVKPRLRPEDHGKFVAVDIPTGEYEVDEDDYSAVKRLRRRMPNADIWLARAGFPAAYRISRET